MDFKARKGDWPGVRDTYWPFSEIEAEDILMGLIYIVLREWSRK